MKRDTALWLALAALLLAAALRIIGAGGYPVWTDEGWSIWAASSPATVIERVAADRHPPLYFAALSLWRIPAGDSHIALRFLSIAGGLILVAAVYRIGADWFGRRAGVFALWLMAALPAAVYYGQEVRHYGWLATFSALSWLIFLRYLRRPRRSLWIGYVLSVAALLYTLYFGVLTLAVQGVVGVIALGVDFRRGARPSNRRLPAPTNPLRIWGLIAAWIAAAILYAPWLYVILTQQAKLLSTGIQGAPGTLTAENVLLILQIVFGLHLLITLGAFALGTWAILRRPGLQRIALLWGGGGLLVAMFVLNAKFDFLAARTLVFLTPLLLIVVGFGLSRLDRRIGVPLAGVWLMLTLAVPQVIQPRLDSGAAARALATRLSAR